MIRRTSVHAQDKCSLPSISNPQETESMNAESTATEGHLYMRLSRGREGGKAYCFLTLYLRVSCLSSTTNFFYR